MFSSVLGSFQTGTISDTIVVTQEVKNPFFKIALNQAAFLIGKPGRVLRLAVHVMHRLYEMDRRHLSVAEFGERLQLLGRLAKAYARGHYRALPIKTLLIILAALLYFLNPFDLVPDAVLGIGLMDDLAVITWVYRSALNELNNFIMWEKPRVTTTIE